MLWQRVLTAIFGIPLAIFVVYLGKWPFFFCVAAIGMIGLKEYFFILSRMGLKPYSFLGYVAGLALLIYIFIRGTVDYLIQVLLLFLLSLAVLHIVQFNKRKLKDLAGTFLGVFYICGLLTYAVVMRQLPYGFWWVIFTLVLIWVNDSGAYFVGRKFGRHKLHQAVSPKKTVEGAIGGILADIIVASLMSFSHNLFSIAEGIILGLIIAIAGIIGDLFESSLKREAGLKDSGSLFPGHGGILDRFDSLLFTFPAVYYFLQGFIIG